MYLSILKPVSYRDCKDLCLAFHFLLYIQEYDIHIAFSLQMIYIENFFESDTQTFLCLLCKIKLMRESEYYLHLFLSLFLSLSLSLPCMEREELCFRFWLSSSESGKNKVSKMNNRVSPRINRNCSSLSAFKKVSSFIN